MAGQSFGSLCDMKDMREIGFFNSNSMTIKEAVTGRLTCRDVDRAMNVILQTTENDEPPQAFYLTLLD